MGTRATGGYMARAHGQIVRRVATTLGIAGTLLCGIACREDQIDGPTGSDSGAEAASLSAVTAAVVVSFSQVARGNRHGCGLTTIGVVYCWARMVLRVV